MLMLVLDVYPAPFIKLAQGAGIELQPSMPAVTAARR
jgi:hypothetical protein